jgi:exosortase/archaeosortase
VSAPAQNIHTVVGFFGLDSILLTDDTIPRDMGVTMLICIGWIIVWMIIELPQPLTALFSFLILQILMNILLYLKALCFNK